MINVGYFIRYRVYGINNTITFHSAAQYQNWIAIMENGLNDQFEVIEICEFNY